MMKPQYLRLINLISLLLHSVRKMEHVPSTERRVYIVLHRHFFTLKEGEKGKKEPLYMIVRHIAEGKQHKFCQTKVETLQGYLQTTF